MNNSNTPTLRRQIGLFGATAIGIGAIIGSGIFVVIGIVAGLSGPALVISILIAGVIALFSALSVAELSSYMPVEGGVYLIAGKLLSPFAGFTAGWIWVFSNIFMGAVESLGFAHYFSAFFPTLPIKGIAIFFCLIFVVINYHGIQTTTLLNNTLVLLKVMILFFFITFGLLFFNSSHFTPISPSGMQGILAGSALIFFAYTGFARVTLMGEEVVSPNETIPRSIYLALGVSTAIYLLVGIVAIGLVPYSVLAQTGSPLTSAMSITQNSFAIYLVSMGAFISTASVLLTTIMGVSRIMYAMAKTGDMPEILSKIHPRYDAPHAAIIATGAGMILAILFADLMLVVAVSTFAMLVYYLIVDLTALRIPRKSQVYPFIVPLIGVISCGSLIVFLTPNAWIIGVIGLGCGVIWYGIRRNLLIIP